MYAVLTQPMDKRQRAEFDSKLDAPQRANAAAAREVLERFAANAKHATAADGMLVDFA